MRPSSPHTHSDDHFLYPWRTAFPSRWAVSVQSPVDAAVGADFFTPFAHLPRRNALSVQSPTGTPASLSRFCSRAFKAVAVARSCSVAPESPATAERARSLRRSATIDPTNPVMLQSRSLGPEHRQFQEGQGCRGMVDRIVRNPNIGLVIIGHNLIAAIGVAG